MSCSLMGSSVAAVRCGGEKKKKEHGAYSYIAPPPSGCEARPAGGAEM